MQLTEKVLCYQLGNWTWSNLWADLQRHIDDFLAYYSLCPDTQARFMNQFEPRLLGMVERFEYRGITFDALLRRSLHLQLRSIFRQMKKERLLFSLSVNNAQTLAEQDPENCYAPSIPDQGCQRPAKGAARSIRQFSTLKVAERRCVVAALKNCLHMTDQLCLDLAQALRLSPQWLISCRDTLYQELHPKLEAKRQLAELIVQLRNSVIADELLDGKRPANKTLSDRLQSRRDRLERLKDKWANWQITPRHHRIAAVLGIPKGTVDSTLYYVRKTPALQAVAD